MNNIKFLKISILILVLINISVLGFFWFGKPPKNDGNRAADFLIKELALNEKQKADFEQLKEQHREAMMPLRKQGGDLRNRYFSYIGKEEIDSAKINITLDSILEVQKQTEIVTFAHFAKVRKLCDKQQQQKFDAIIGEALKMMRPSPPPPPRK